MVNGLLSRLIGAPRNTTKQEEYFDVQKLDHLVISTDVAQVDILTHELPRVDILLESYEDGPVLTTEKTEDILTITAKKEKKGPTFVFGNLPKSRLQIWVPKDIADNWDVSTTSGKIVASQIITNVFMATANSGTVELASITAGKVTCNTTSGKLKIEDLKAEKLRFSANSGIVDIRSAYGDIFGKVGSGNVRITSVKGEELEVKAGSGKISLNEVYMKNAFLRANSGKIEAESFWVETTNATVGSGKIDIRDFRGDIKGNTSSGNINISVSDNSALDLKTGSGSIHVEFHEFKLNAAFDIKTGSGDLITNLPMAVEQRENHHLHGKSGNGDNLIRIRTGSGNAVLYTAKSSLIKQGKGN